MLVTKITLYMPLIAIFNATFCLTSQKKYFTMHQCSVTSHFYIGGYLSANFGWVTWNEITWYKWTTLTDTIFDRKRDLEPTVIDKAYSKTDGSNCENRFTAIQIMTHFSWLINMSDFKELIMSSKKWKTKYDCKLFLGFFFIWFVKLAIILAPTTKMWWLNGFDAMTPSWCIVMTS